MNVELKKVVEVIEAALKQEKEDQDYWYYEEFPWQGKRARIREKVLKEVLLNILRLQVDEQPR